MTACGACQKARVLFKCASSHVSPASGLLRPRGSLTWRALSHGYHGDKSTTVDFTSKDILGIQQYWDGRRQAEWKPSSPTPNCQSKRRTNVTKELSAKMSKLLGKEKALVTNLEICDINRHLQTVLECDEAIEVELGHSGEMDLEKAPHSLGRKLVIVHLEPQHVNVDALLRLCDTAESRGDKVMLADMHGSILLRHLLGERRDVIEALQRPHVVYSSLSLLSQQSSVGCLSSSHEIIHKMDTRTPDKQYGLHKMVTEKIDETLQILPHLALNAIQATCGLLYLKSKLEDHGFSTQTEGYSLLIKVDCMPTADNPAKLLQRQGFGVDAAVAKKGKEKFVSLRVSAYHSKHNLDSLVQALSHLSLVKPSEEQALHTNPHPMTKSLHAQPSKGKYRTVALGDILKKRKIVPKISAIPKTSHSAAFDSWDKPDEDWALLESVYSWDSYHSELKMPCKEQKDSRQLAILESMCSWDSYTNVSRSALVWDDSSNQLF